MFNDGPTETKRLMSSPKDLAEDMCSAIQQNPQVVASVVNHLSRQMVQSHHAYQNLDVSFNDFRRAYKDQGKGQGSMPRSLADIRKGIDTSNGIHRQSLGVLKDIHTELKNTRDLGEKLEVVLLGVTAASRKQAPSHAAVHPHDSPAYEGPNIDRAASDRECEWQERQVEGIHHLEQRQGMFHTPLDSYYTPSY